MKVFIGSPGTVSGLMLRIYQCAFAAASIAVMVSASDFSSYTAFCYLIASMGLQLLWSFGLACLDVYALRRKRDLQNPVLVSLFVVGDWVTAMLSLAAACSSAGVIVLYARDLDFCRPLSKGFEGSHARNICPHNSISYLTWPVDHPKEILDQA
ncbi:hypothetical protein GOBAR_AA34123 [Gossypium barbadense]|uniref:CASP-like protein n=1 Tax=Gossypium barbadense TaxID=3634 RepID=A0A2P5W634_GOSBA|nr:hypothetical protein GOBAR_AA34123 [Gossypium barbadense]